MKKISLLISIIIILSIDTVLSMQIRDTIDINSNWKFCIDDKNEGFENKWYISFPEISSIVTTPHTWNVDNQYENHYGWAWYQQEIEVPKAWKTQKIILEIGAANHTSHFFVNGNEIATNIGNGYNKLNIDITRFLNFGKQNKLTIAVCNDFGKNKVPHANSFDWSNDGGLIRPVKLIVSNKNSAEYAHLTPSVELPNSFDKNNILTKAENADLSFAIGFDNTTIKSFDIDIQIFEENQKTNNCIFSETKKVNIVNNKANFNIKLKEVNLWHFDYPNLYKVKLILRNKGKVFDEITTITGFKSLKFKDNKFYLNGESVKLMGVEWTSGSHPDFGLAETEKEIIRHGKMMKVVNCIFSRVHFQQSEIFYDFCNRNGILIQEEIPLWGWDTPSDSATLAIATNHLQMMIKNHFNHPSIMAWGVGNELNGRDSATKRMISKLVTHARALDPSRFVTYMSNSLTHSYKTTENFVEDVATCGDYLMMNEYCGTWWNTSIGNLTYHLDSVHFSYPQMPFFISEFGICEPNFKGGDERRIHDMIYHHAVYESKPWILGAIYFDLTDYRTHYGAGEGRFKQRIHGVYDAYGNPKKSMATLREISSPVEILQLHKWQEDSLHIEIHGNIGIPQYKVVGYKLYFSENEESALNSNPYDIPTLNPGEKTYIKVRNLFKGKGVVTIVRPNGYVVSQKRF